VRLIRLCFEIAQGVALAEWDDDLLALKIATRYNTIILDARVA
jgi:hypothetical protein